LLDHLEALGIEIGDRPPSAIEVIEYPEF